MPENAVRLPEDLYARAREFGVDHSLSVEEVVSRALERLLSPADGDLEDWMPPPLRLGKTSIPIEELREYARDDEQYRATPDMRPAAGP